MPLEENAQPGWFRVEDGAAGHAWLQYNCPCGCGSVGQIHMVPTGTPHDSRTWEWDGNRERPTLSPSIRRTIDCKFHGHLQAGVWSACADGAQLAANVYRC